MNITVMATKHCNNIAISAAPLFDFVPYVSVNVNVNAGLILMKNMLVYGLFAKRKCIAGVEIYYSIAVKFY